MTARTTITLVRAARELLGWNQDVLAKKAKVGVATLRRYERGETIQDENIDAILGALERAGIAFVRDKGEAGAIIEGVTMTTTRTSLNPIRSAEPKATKKVSKAQPKKPSKPRPFASKG